MDGQRILVIAALLSGGIWAGGVRADAVAKPDAGKASSMLLADAGDLPVTEPADSKPVVKEKVSKSKPAGERSIETTAIRAIDLPPSTKPAEVERHEATLYEKFSPVIEAGGALAIVIGLILVGRGLVKRFVPGAGVGSGKGVMEVLARYPLARNQSLVLVRIGSQLVVLNQGREMSQSVLVINEPMEVAKLIGQVEGAKPNSISAGFSNLLEGAQQELSQPETDDVLTANRMMDSETLDTQLDEMAAAKRQLMELRQQVRSMRSDLPLSR